MRVIGVPRVKMEMMRLSLYFQEQKTRRQTREVVDKRHKAPQDVGSRGCWDYDTARFALKAKQRAVSQNNLALTVGALITARLFPNMDKVILIVSPALRCVQVVTTLHSHSIHENPAAPASKRNSAAHR